MCLTPDCMCLTPDTWPRVRQDRAGMLGRVNLGLSGLNLLWVIE